MAEPTEMLRYRMFERGGLYFLTSPDHRGLLVATVSRKDTLDATPEALRNYRFRATGLYGPLPKLTLVEA